MNELCVCKVTRSASARLYCERLQSATALWFIMWWDEWLCRWCWYLDNSYNIASSQVQNHHLPFESWHFLLLLRKLLLLLLLAVGKYYPSVILVHWPTPILSYILCLIVGHRLIFLQPAEGSAMCIVIAALYHLLSIGRYDTVMAGWNRPTTIVIKKWSTTKWSCNGMQGCAATFLIL